VATELIGWLAATILLATLGRQVYSQWRNGPSQGISKWLFTGQVSASTAFVVYSWLLANWVFVVTNGLILVTPCSANGFTFATSDLTEAGVEWALLVRACVRVAIDGP
jgi:MtN3 and saliva related transmembrane protein